MGGCLQVPYSDAQYPHQQFWMVGMNAFVYTCRDSKSVKTLKFILEISSLCYKKIIKK